MLLRETVIQAIYSLTVNKLRSWLTIMGVAVGVFSIIAVMTALDAIDKSVEIRPHKPRSQHLPDTEKSSHSIRQRTQPKFLCQPERYLLQAGAPFPKKHGNKCPQYRLHHHQSGKSGKICQPDHQPRCCVCLAVTRTFQHPTAIAIASGRNLSESDIRSARNAAVIGSELAETLFPSGENPLNKFIKVNGEVYTVCGVFEKKGAAFGQSQDNFVLIPITRYLDHINEKSSLSITVEALSRKEYQASDRPGNRCHATCQRPYRQGDQ